MAKSKNRSEKTPQLVDHVDESSDEEIDEDLAFDSDDERQYGSFFVHKSSLLTKKSTSKRKWNQDDSDEDNDEDSGDDDDDDDSDIHDDENSDQTDDDDDDSNDGIASDDEDGDGGQFMLDLLNNLDQKQKDTKTEEHEIRSTLKHTSMIPESQFSSTVFSNSKSNNNHNPTTSSSSGGLTLDQLMNGITDTKGYTSVKHAMKDMTTDINITSTKLSTTKTPVAKVISERAERKVYYEEQSQNISEWTTVVKQNREAETLDFRPSSTNNNRIRAMNKAELVQKFEPTTEFEKEIAAALEEEGALAVNEEDIMKREEHAMFGNGTTTTNDDDAFDDIDDDDLGMNKLSPQEYKKRLGELSKMRALMFYEEQKRHHIHKIKSKKYRKIRKKRKLRNKEEEEKDQAMHDKDFARELEEKAEMERMKERMSLKHRNTSKWAKRVLRRGGNIDVETRKALSEQIRMGDELKKKIEGQYYGNSDDDDDDEFDLLAQAKKILKETEDDDKKKNESEEKGIFKLAFMKKGIEAQRERAKQEARELLRELEANEESGGGLDGSDVDNDESNDEEETNKGKKKPKIASAKEMESVLSKGKLVATSLTFGNSDSIQVSGDIDLNSSNKPKTATQKDSDSTKMIALTTHEIENVDETSTTTQSKLDVSVSKTNIKSKSNVVEEEEESNPWLASVGKGDTDKNDSGMDSNKHRKKKSLPSVSRDGIVNVADAVNIISGGDDDNEKEALESKTTTSENEDSEKANNNSEAKIATLSQDELVKKAFATPSENEIEEEFEQEKVKYLQIPFSEN